MTEKDEKESWEQFIHRKRIQRLQEGAELWSQMQEAGLGEGRQAVLDFVHFAANFEDVNALSHALSVHYSVEVEADAENAVYYAKGTTHPRATPLSEESHRKWVEYMADIGKTHGCVFSAWCVEVPELQQRFDSASLAASKENVE